MTSVVKLQELIENEISKLTFGDHPRELYEPISYILSLGGKRMRPLLVLLGYSIYKDNPKDIVRPALATEVFHNFTLMHDDIMDQAPLRRGKPTVHEKWDQTVAILSGDTMLVKAYELFLDLEKSLIPPIISLFNKTAVEVCEGQQIDMNFESREEVKEEEYMEMIRLKTALLLGFSLQAGGLMAQADTRDQQLLYDIGECMGVGFQLMDDLLDVYGDQDKFGKKVGGDIVANKKTYLLIKAMELAKGKNKIDLLSLISKDDADESEKVQSVKKIYDELGIRKLTTHAMNSYFDKAFTLIEKLDGSDESKKVLLQFSRHLMKRES